MDQERGVDFLKFYILARGRELGVPEKELLEIVAHPDPERTLWKKAYVAHLSKGRSSKVQPAKTS